jgi:hypothetical protein
MVTLQQLDEWVIWKSKDKWSPLLKVAGFHQLLYIKKDTQEDCWGSKIKGWWRTGDIRVIKPNKTYECWVKSKETTPPGAQEAMITALQAPNHNFGKDEYVIDMMGHEAHYWQGTESGLLGVFEFKGACTAGDGSCDSGSKSMGAGFCNLGQLGWNTQTPLPPPALHEQRTRNSRKVGREDEGVSSTRPEMVALAECLEDHGDDINLLYLTDSEAILVTTSYPPMDRMRSETKPLKSTRCGRPQENHNQTTKENSSGSSNIANQSQSSQGGPAQRGGRHQSRNGTPQSNPGGRLE